jgi:hypothetical protein
MTSGREEHQMDLIGNGFLTPEGSAEAQCLGLPTSAQLAVAERAVALCQTALESVELSGQATECEKQKLIACVVLARILEASEAMVLLAQRGFSVEVTAVFRNFLDAYFVFGNLCKDRAFVARYFNSDLKTRQKLVNAAAKHRAEPFTLVNSYASSEVRKELAEKMSEMNATEFNSYQHAHDIGCADVYDSMYRISSAATHSTVRSLVDYVREDEMGNIVQIRRLPQVADIPERLLDLTAFLLNVRAAFDDLFGLEQHSEARAIRDLLEAFPAPAPSEEVGDRD